MLLELLRDGIRIKLCVYHLQSYYRNGCLFTANDKETKYVNKSSYNLLDSGFVIRWL